MARIRSIKPEFWSDETITECSLSARLLFIGIWNFADDAGNLDRSAKQIKARVFPVDNVDCDPLIAELIAHGLLIEYSVSDRKYLHIPGFAKHQVINRPSAPVVPAYDDSLTTQVALSEPSVSTPAGREGKGKEGGAGARVQVELHESLPKESWGEWLEHRRRKRYPTDDLTLRKQLTLLAKHSSAEQAEMIDTAINAGWQGLFPPKKSAKPASNPYRNAQ